MVRILFFDAAGTLFRLPRGVGSHYAEVARRHGVEIDPAALDAAFRAAWKKSAPLLETRTPRHAEDREWWRTLAGEVFAACGAGAVLERCFDDLWEAFARPGVWELFPETREVLQGLRGTYRLGVISNFDERLHRVLGHLGIAEFFEHVVVSSEVGAEKPSLTIFHSALARFGIAAHEARHIGDEAEADWQGATRAGLQIFPLHRPSHSLRDIPEWAALRSATSLPAAN